MFYAALLLFPVRPTSITASSNSRSPRPGLYELNERDQLTLRCDVTGARPAAAVQWQRNGVPIQLGEHLSTVPIRVNSLTLRTSHGQISGGIDFYA